VAIGASKAAALNMFMQDQRLSIANITGDRRHHPGTTDTQLPFSMCTPEKLFAGVYYGSLTAHGSHQLQAIVVRIFPGWRSASLVKKN